MDRKSYKAFTLIEMLIVMGILVILMVVGIAAGRFATQRAQDIAHQNAAAQIYQALQSYYVDFGKYPGADATSGGDISPRGLLGTSTNPGIVGKYMDLGAFDGGNDATFWYFVNTGTHQSVVVCVSLGGYNDVSERGVYCDGNGFGDEGLNIGSTNAATMPKGRLEYHPSETYYNAVKGGENSSNWNGGTNAWE
mgnify:CR=1 FL=1